MKIVVFILLFIALFVDIVYLVFSARDIKASNTRVFVAIFDFFISEYVAIEIFLGLLFALIILIYVSIKL